MMSESHCLKNKNSEDKVLHDPLHTAKCNIGTKVSMTLSEFPKVLSEILKMKHAKKQPGSSRIMGKPFLKVFGLGHF